MEWTVKLFGPPARALGRGDITLSCDTRWPTCAELRTRLATAAPELEPFLRGARLAVNHAFAPDQQQLNPGDEIALITMVSGG